MSGATLMKDTTIDVVSSLSPFYAGIGQVKLNGGTFLRKTSDLTIACAIYNSSQEADLMLPFNFTMPTDQITANKFIGARTQWVTAKATQDLILNVIGLAGAPGSHVLANFSVSRERTSDAQGIAAKLADLRGDIDKYAVTLASSAATIPGGHPLAGFAAKGSRDFGERTPSRIWTTTGIGVNRKGWDYINLVGGRGKPVNYFQHVFFSPTVVNYRSGIYPGGFPLQTTFFLLD